ncbi:MAG TPA: DUF1080 domain-containing protein [Cyclobacteriaceae bacterium]
MKYCLLLLLSFMVGQSMAQAPNTLSAQEKKDGWELLFDGKTTKGWRNYNSKETSAAWKINDESLYLDRSNKEVKGGDLITEGEYENYEFTYDWKISKCGNSGLIFGVVEAEKYKAVWHTGPEMQVLDNACHPDAKIIKHRAGDLYDLISCSTETVKPAEEWNTAKIISKNAHYEFYLNGTKVVEFTMHTPEWDAMVAGSKFKSMPDFGKATKGHFALQDHGDPVWFRNIKIKKLK